MKKLFVHTVLIVMAASFASCKKYEEGPAISLFTKKMRLTGDWKADSFKTQTEQTDASGNVTTTTDESSNGSDITHTVVNEPSGSTSTTTTTNGTCSVSMSFKKNGTYTTKYNTSFTDSYTVFGIPTTSTTVTDISEKGTWNFAGGTGDEKNKQKLIISASSRTTVTTNTTGSSAGSTTSTNTETETLSGDEDIYTIMKLKNKEIHLRLAQSTATTNTSASGTGTTSKTVTSDIHLVQ